jgi:tripartite-type tricarboxylate transporter receptor subunit TctC
LTQRFTRRAIAGSALGATLLGAGASAQDAGWPARPVRIVIAFPPGGSSDIIARLVADRLTPRIGQQVLAENRPGGGAMIAAEHVVRAGGDGHTIMFASSTVVITAATRRNPPVDIRRDLVPLSNMVEAPMLLVGSVDAPFNTLRGLVEYAKANPGRVNIGIPGAGSSNHLALELMLRRAQVQATVVPYQGNAPQLTALLRNDIHAAIDSIATSTPFSRDGKIRALAVTGARRAALLPEVPTVAEAVPLPDYAASFWFGLMAPTAMPRAAIDRLARETAAVMAEPDMREHVARQGYEVVAAGAAPFGERINADLELWGRVARDAGLIT